MSILKFSVYFLSVRTGIMEDEFEVGKRNVFFFEKEESYFPLWKML